MAIISLLRYRHTSPKWQDKPRAACKIHERYNRHNTIEPPRPFWIRRCKHHAQCKCCL